MRILITGGSSEIGQAIAEERIKMGDEVFITASSSKTLEATLASYKAKKLKVTGFPFSLEEPEKSEADLKKILKGGFEGLVLNAAGRNPKLALFHEIDSSDFNSFVRTNIEGNLWLLRQIIPRMVENKFGRLVLISSLSAAQGTSRYPAYCLFKAALEGLFLNLATDYGEFNVLSSIVRPGVIATERNKRFWKRTHYAEKACEIIPQKTFGHPIQIAEAVNPLLSKNSYMNGSIIQVAGGLPMLRTAGILKL